jgi:hypothetical protein
VPAVIVIVAFVALLAYLASQVSSHSQKALAASAARRDHATDAPRGQVAAKNRWATPLDP